MADRFRAPSGRIVERGPELIRELRRRYTSDYFAERLDEGDETIVIDGKEYYKGQVLRAVDPERFRKYYESELENVTSGDYDDVLTDIFGFERIQGSENAKKRCCCGKSRCTGCGKCGSENLMPRSSKGRSSPKKAPAKKANKGRR